MKTLVLFGTLLFLGSLAQAEPITQSGTEAAGALSGAMALFKLKLGPLPGGSAEQDTIFGLFGRGQDSLTSRAKISVTPTHQQGEMTATYQRYKGHSNDRTNTSSVRFSPASGFGVLKVTERNKHQYSNTTDKVEMGVIRHSEAGTSLVHVLGEWIGKSAVAYQSKRVSPEERLRPVTLQEMHAREMGKLMLKGLPSQLSEAVLDGAEVKVASVHTKTFRQLQPTLPRKVRQPPVIKRTVKLRLHRPRHTVHAHHQRDHSAAQGGHMGTAAQHIVKSEGAPPQGRAATLCANQVDLQIQSA